MTDKTEQFKKILELLNTDVPSKKEVALIMAEFFKVLSQQKRDFDKQMKEMMNIVKTVKAKKGDKGDPAKPVDERKIIDILSTKLPKEDRVIEAVITRIGPIEKDNNIDPVKIAKIAKEDIIYSLPKFGEKFRDGLELLSGDDRLDKKAIKGFEELEKKINSINVSSPNFNSGSGLRGFELYIDSVSKGLTQFLNLIPGTGITLSYTTVGQRSDITINSSGGGSSASFVNNELVAVGDGVTTIFTLDNTPIANTVEISVGGSRQTPSSNFTVSGTTLTFISPPPDGQDILADYQVLNAAAVISGSYLPGFNADGGGLVISTGKIKGYWTAKYAGTITGWSLSLNSGTATVKVWKIASGTAVPTSANSINTSGVAISSGTHIHSTTLTDFTTTAVTAGDVFAFNIEAVSSATEMTFNLEILNN